MEVDVSTEPTNALPKEVPNIVSRKGHPLKSAIRENSSSLGKSGSSKSSDNNTAKSLAFSKQVHKEPTITQESLRSMGYSQTNITQIPDCPDSSLTNLRSI